MKNFNQIYDILIKENADQELLLNAVDIYIQLARNNFKNWGDVILKIAKRIGKDRKEIEEKIKNISKIESFRDIYNIIK